MWVGCGLMPPGVQYMLDKYYILHLKDLLDRWKHHIYFLRIKFLNKQKSLDVNKEEKNKPFEKSPIRKNTCQE